MKKDRVRINGFEIPVYSLNTVVVGSGAASLNCVDHLFSFGQKDIAIVTDALGGGTSNNAGSDKQTYYKLSLSSEDGDSPYKMAEDLFKGGAMHGDIALIEAALSLQEFYHLIQIGVEFPHNRYGIFVGYKTDHDLSQRATSVGPLTSKQMVQGLLKEIKNKGIKIFDKHQVIKLLTEGKSKKKRIIGVLAIDKTKTDKENFGMVLFNCENVVFGTGGPGSLYKDSVYPENQIGSIGLALEIGAEACNLTESQFGIASIKFRWNLSGTYQQVIPCYFSTNKDGTEPRDFLNKHFPAMRKMTTAIFLKGYQWPFDPRKIKNYGSSIIDLLVYEERNLKGRKVFMDFTQNPKPGDGLGEFNLRELDHEAYEYLKKSKALLPRPIDRLRKMNPGAIELYKTHNIDITKEPLEIAVCAQHNNGGLAGNIWWESNIKHFFPIGEVNGTHGVYRPGGSALNSGQVGGLRAAQFITKRYASSPLPLPQFTSHVKARVKEKLNYIQSLVKDMKTISTVEKIKDKIQTRMTSAGAHIRELYKIKESLAEAYLLQNEIKNRLRIKIRAEFPDTLKTAELCFTHIVYLEAIRAYLEEGGGSRGSYIVLDNKGVLPLKTLGERWKYKKYTKFLSDKVSTIVIKNGQIKHSWNTVRPIPHEIFWFENIWNEYMQDKIIC